MVIPQGHDEDVAASKGSSHTVQATEGLERGSVSENALLGIAELLGDGVASDAGDGRVAVLVDLAVLHVEALDFREGGARADELSDDSHLLLGVELHAGAVEVLDAHAVAVEVAAVLVADAAIAVVTVTAVGASAGYETSALARVGSVGSGDGVGLPDVHLSAAGTELAGSTVRVGVRWVPALDVGGAVDPLDVVGALGVAVSSSVLCTSLVVALADATISSHFDEVQSSIQATGELRDINVKGELLADEVEHLVLGISLHEVSTRTDIGAVLSLGDELDAQSIVASGDTISALES